MFNKAVLQINQPTGDGTVHRVVFLFTGNAGESKEQPLLCTREQAADLAFLTDNARSIISGLLKSTGKIIIEGTILDVTPPVSPVRTAKQKFFDDLGLWYRVNMAISAGILTGLETEVSALKTLVKSEYSATFLNDF